MAGSTRSVATAVAGLLVASVLAACSASGTGAAPATTTEAPPAGSTTEPTATSVDPEVIYDPTRDAHADIAAALDRADERSTRVLIDFGADWCPPCHTVDEAFQTPEISAVLDADFEVVKVDIGDWDHNMDLFGDEYGEHTAHAIPAVVILDPTGEVVGSTADTSDLDEMSREQLFATLATWAG